MPIPSVPPFLPGVIGEAADVLNIVAETPPGSGALSYKSGWPALTALPLEAGGVAPQREYFNAVNKLLSQHTLFQQAGGVYPWDAALDYRANAIVQGSDGEAYMALRPSGPDTPSPDGTGTVGPVDPVGDESGHWLALKLLFAGAPNSEVWLTESGQWTAPVDGWYNVLCIAGGEGSFAHSIQHWGFTGQSGEWKEDFVYLQAGETVNVVVGSGGKKGTGTTWPTPGQNGGNTSFAGKVIALGSFSGDSSSYIACAYGTSHTHNDTNGSNGANQSNACAQGPGGTEGAPRFYGAGGGINIWNYANNTTATTYDGKQGVIRIRWHDPARAAGPLPAPAPLKARRMARAADAPATVNLYDPETGQGSVWREEDASAKLAEGLITEEAWRERCAEQAAQEYAAWLADPETEAERFALLRAEREARLAATDYLTAADYPLAEEQRAEVTAYRQALRDLPAQEGAPWDGGGKETPWPENPQTVKA